MYPFIPGWAYGRAAADGGTALGGGPFTLMQDNFNRADTTAGLGTSSDGTWNWSQTGTTLGISSNQLYSPAGTGSNALCVTSADLTSSDHYSQVTVATVLTSAKNFCGVIARSNATIDTYYEYFWRASTGAWQLGKVVSGVFTQIGSSGATSNAAGDVFKIVVSGTTIQGYKNGVLDISTTDSAISTGTRAGIYFSPVNSSGTRFDDFACGV